MVNIKAVLNPNPSIKLPKAKGIIAPPTIAIQSNPEACAFKSPKPSSVKVKMVGNIIELNKPTAKIDHIETKPTVLIEIAIKTIASKAKILSTLPGDIIFVK